MDSSSPLAKPVVDVSANIASFRSTGEVQPTPGPSAAVSQPGLQPGYLGVLQPPPRTLAEAQQQRQQILNEIARRQALITSLESKIKSATTWAIICFAVGFFVFGILWIVAIILLVQNGQNRGKINQYSNEIMMLQQQLYQLDQVTATLRS
jgi:hypothetical protein